MLSTNKVIKVGGVVSLIAFVANLSQIADSKLVQNITDSKIFLEVSDSRIMRDLEELLGWNKKSIDTKQYLLPESSKRLLVQSDLQGLDTATLALARNEIFARHGRKFQSKLITDYFKQYDWYHPKEWEVKLSDVERKNVALIRDLEKER